MWYYVVVYDNEFWWSKLNDFMIFERLEDGILNSQICPFSGKL